MVLSIEYSEYIKVGLNSRLPKNAHCVQWGNNQLREYFRHFDLLYICHRRFIENVRFPSSLSSNSAYHPQLTVCVYQSDFDKYN